MGETNGQHVLSRECSLQQACPKNTYRSSPIVFSLPGCCWTFPAPCGTTLDEALREQFLATNDRLRWGLRQHLPHGAGKSEQDTQHDLNLFPPDEAVPHALTGVPLTIPLGVEGCLPCLAFRPPREQIVVVIGERIGGFRITANSSTGRVRLQLRDAAWHLSVTMSKRQPSKWHRIFSYSRMKTHRLLRMIPGIRCCGRRSRRKVASDVIHREPRETL